MNPSAPGNQQPTPGPTKPPPPSAPRTVVGLARLATGPGRRPVDRVIERLEGPGGPHWLARVLAHSPMGDAAGPTLGVSVPLDRLLAEKERGKALMAHPDSQDFETGVLLYLLAVALARRQHARVITSQSVAVVDDALADLATAMPPRWGEACMPDGGLD